MKKLEIKKVYGMFLSAVSALVIGAVAQAYPGYPGHPIPQPYPYPGPYLQIGSDTTLNKTTQSATFLVDSWSYVDQIYISAHGKELITRGRLTVEIDGVRLKVLRFKRRSRSYQVPVQRVVGQVTLRILNDEPLVIESIAVSGRFGGGVGPYPTPVNPGYSTRLVGAARGIVFTLDRLQPVVGPAEFAQHLLSLKQAAARLMTTASAHGDAAVETRNAGQALIDISTAEGEYLNQLLERTAAFGLVTQLLQNVERIAEALD